ncbi:MAG: PD-(D/E)XK motif protein [Planctomycetaceae bacterium]
MMKSEAMWREMRGEQLATSGWRSRRASAAGYPIELALQPQSGMLAIVLPAELGSGPVRRHWPESRGLEVNAMLLDGRTCRLVKLREPAFEEVFCAFADDVVQRILPHQDSAGAVQELLGRLTVWQQFLAAIGTPLAPAARRGLWGELHVLVHHLAPIVGIEAAVRAWTGDSPNHQDFQLAGGALEVKLTTSKQPQSIRITSERQLDYRGDGQLILHVVIANEDEQSCGAGSSLNSIIQELKTLVGTNTALWLQLSEVLLRRGWVDRPDAGFDTPRWLVRSEHAFRVAEGFPRITEAMLASGVGDVNYALSLAACESFRVSCPEVYQTLCQTPPRDSLP